MKKITVFTPTYNRAYCLPQLYESLLRQTSDDFLWLVIDDGSTDNTKELIESWIEEDIISIQYSYKENGGMHTGHNLALRLIETELNVCIDSDDYLTDDSIEVIIDFWELNKSKNYAGILGLNAYKNGNLVSSKRFPDNVTFGKYRELKSRYGIVGDVKFVYKTSVIKKYPPYPTFENEKFVPLGYKYKVIESDYDMLYLNKILCIVDYVEDGSTLNIYKQYLRNPKGFRYTRLINMEYCVTIKEKYILAVHFVAESLLGKVSVFKDNKNVLITLLAIPLGILLYFYILYKNKK